MATFKHTTRAAMMSTILLAATSTACVQHTWAPGPGAQLSFGQASGQCKLAAEGVPTGVGAVYAQGSPQFVGAYTGAIVIAGAIAGAVKQNNVYNACMEASGFVPVDAQPGAVQQ